MRVGAGALLAHLLFVALLGRLYALDSALSGSSSIARQSCAKPQRQAKQLTLTRGLRPGALQQLRNQHVFTPCLEVLQQLEGLQAKYSPSEDLLTKLRDELQTLRYLERVAHDKDDMWFFKQDPSDLTPEGAVAYATNKTLPELEAEFRTADALRSAQYKRTQELVKTVLDWLAQDRLEAAERLPEHVYHKERRKLESYRSGDMTQQKQQLLGEGTRRRSLAQVTEEQPVEQQAEQDAGQQEDDQGDGDTEPQPSAEMVFMTQCVTTYLNPRQYRDDRPLPNVTFIIDNHNGHGGSTLLPKVLDRLHHCYVQGAAIEAVIHFDSVQGFKSWAGLSWATKGFAVPLFAASTPRAKRYARAVAVTRAPIVVLLQPDVPVPLECAWISSIESAFEEKPRLGALGSSHYYGDWNPSSVVQPPPQAPAGEVIDWHASGSLQFVAAVSLGPLALRKAAWSAVGGLDDFTAGDEQCAPCTFLDLSARLWLAGWQVMHSPLLQHLSQPPEAAGAERDNGGGGGGGAESEAYRRASQAALECPDLQWGACRSLLQLRFGAPRVRARSRAAAGADVIPAVGSESLDLVKTHVSSLNSNRQQAAASQHISV